jgi:signal peptidase I
MTDEISGKMGPKLSFKSEVWEFLKFGVLAALIILPIRMWIAQPFIVHGDSMVPTFHGGDYLIIDEVTYRFREPQRGDVIVFRYPKNPSQFFIKRVAGLPGDSINGLVLAGDEYYVLGDNTGQSSDSRFWGPVKKNLIIGRAVVRLWPFASLGVL